MKKCLSGRDKNDKRPVLILAEDEGRFGRINSPRRCWAPSYLRPNSPREVIREYVYVYSAVCPSQGKLTSLILPRADSQMMSLFLEHVSKEFTDYFLIMVLDRAGWHLSQKLVTPENISLLPLPPYSPELNPVEHLWEEIREKGLSNTAFQSLNELEDKLCEKIREISENTGLIKSMTNFPYLNVTL